MVRLFFDLISIINAIEIINIVATKLSYPKAKEDRESVGLYEIRKDNQGVNLDILPKCNFFTKNQDANANKIDWKIANKIGRAHV